MLADAYAIVREIASPDIEMMFDYNNESEEAARPTRRWWIASSSG